MTVNHYFSSTGTARARHHPTPLFRGGASASCALTAGLRLAGWWRATLLSLVLLTASLIGAGQEATVQERPFQLEESAAGRDIRSVLQEVDALRKVQPDSAIARATEAYQRALRANHYPSIAATLLKLGACYFDQEDYLKSLFYFEQAYPYCLLSGSEQRGLLGDFYNSKANVLLAQGYYDSSILYYYRSLVQLHHQVDTNQAGYMLTYANLGSALTLAGEQKQALFYLNASQRFARTLGSDRIIAQNYENIGLNFVKRGDRETARRYYEKAREIYRKLDYRENEQRIYYLIGLLEGKAGNYTQARHLLDTALRMLPGTGRENASILIAYGDLHFSLKEFKTAMAYYQQAVAICREKGTAFEMLMPLYQLAQCAHALDRPDAAFRYQKTYSDLKDSLMTLKNREVINRLEVKYRTAEQSRALATQQLQLIQQERDLLSRNMWIIIILAAFLGLLSMLIVFYFRQKQKQNRQKALMQQLAWEQQEGLRQALVDGEERERQRIARELHDGVASMLSAAKMHLDMPPGDKPASALPETYSNGLKLLDEAYNLIRNTAHSLAPPSQLFEKGLAAAINRYCRQVSKPGTLEIFFNRYGPEPELPQDFSLSVYRIVQELIHNALKHAEATELLVEISVLDAQLLLQVEDNGNGRLDLDALPEGRGLRNLMQRVRLLEGKMEVDSQPEAGTAFRIIFELKNGSV